jgi:hypothetical protein
LDRKVVVSALAVGAEVAGVLDQPRGVGAGNEGAHGVADVLDGLEEAAVHDLRVQGAEEALDDAIGFGLADEGSARCHARPEHGSGSGRPRP